VEVEEEVVEAIDNHPTAHRTQKEDKIMHIAPSLLPYYAEEDGDDEVDEQTILLRRAFAEDDVTEEFEKEKEQLERSKDLPAALALPGWGSWAGGSEKGNAAAQNGKDAQSGKSHTQTKPKQNPAFPTIPDADATLYAIPEMGNEKKQQMTLQTELDDHPRNAPTTRKRKTLKTVRSNKIQLIVDKDKMHIDEKYTVRDLPIGMTPEEFQREIATPLGREWTPTLVHRSLTKPAVVTKAGRAIEPITLESSKRAAKHRKKAKAYVNKYNKAR